MTLWRLKLIDLSDPNWQASSHRAQCVVRAPTADAAREAAEHAFGVKTRFPPVQGIVAPPWKRASLVKAEPIKDDRYDAEGATEVLDPSI